MATVASAISFNSGITDKNGYPALPPPKRTAEEGETLPQLFADGPPWLGHGAQKPYKSIDYQLVRDSCKPLFAQYTLFLGDSRTRSAPTEKTG